MVPAHAIELGGLGWNAKTEDLPNGVKLIVTSTDSKQVVKLRALGFMGIMVEGGHHQPHHLAMAKSEMQAQLRRLKQRENRDWIWSGAQGCSCRRQRHKHPPLCYNALLHNVYRSAMRALAQSRITSNSPLSFCFGAPRRLGLGLLAGLEHRIATSTSG
jgi:hypothetical protein